MFYTPLPTDDELEKSGFSREDYAETAEVWPENWPSFEFFRLLETQWRFGLSGPTGLHYETVFDLLDRKGFSGEAFWEMFEDIRVMEGAALAARRTG